MSVAVAYTQRARGYHHGDLREALIEAGMAAVAAQGFDHLSLRAIAQEIGVSPSAAYHHFADKDALLREVGLRVVAMLDDAVIDAAQAIEGTGAQAALARSAAAGMAYIDFATTNVHLFRAAFSGLCSSTAPGDEGAGRQYLMGLLDDLVETGALAQGARNGAEQVLWATVHGLAVLVIEGQLDRADIPTYLATMQRMMRSDEAQ
jgi:AcrR family transcriptional regulator